MKIKENGRSMVEMLGVLAIVGILSAGALAGYSKAMFKYKVNQTIDVFENVMQNLIELDQKDLGENFSISTAEQQTQYGLLPNCQEVGGHYAQTGCRLPIGDLDIDIYKCDYGGICGLVTLFFNDVNSCIAFSSAPWNQVVPTDFLGHIQVSEDGKYQYSQYPGNNIPLTLAQISEACQTSCEDPQLCYFQLYIREY